VSWWPGPDAHPHLRGDLAAIEAHRGAPRLLQVPAPLDDHALPLAHLQGTAGGEGRLGIAFRGGGPRLELALHAWRAPRLQSAALHTAAACAGVCWRVLACTSAAVSSAAHGSCMCACMQRRRVRRAARQRPPCPRPPRHR